MKKNLALMVIAISALIVISCSSTKGDARDTAVYKQNEELNRPHWVGAQFTTKMNKSHYYWEGGVDDAGFFASGEAKYSDVKTSTQAADLDGKAALANYAKQNITSIASELSKNEGGDSETEKELQNFTQTVSSITISGIMRVDRYIAEDGTVYVLMYVPTEEVEKALKNKDNSEFANRVLDKVYGLSDAEKE